VRQTKSLILWDLHLNLTHPTIAIIKWSESRWDRVRKGLAGRSTQISVTQEDLTARYQLAEKMFPMRAIKTEELVTAFI
jgi:hypothetical protein